jgi:CubicO group peptidase (beta-lactamase class C family)
VRLFRRAFLRSVAWAGGSLWVGARRASADDALHAAVDRDAGRLPPPGVCVAVVARGASPRFFAFGRRDVDADAPVRPDTVFRVASITKVFSGMALLQLRDAGVLGLDDPITRWIPEAHVLPRITLRHLVTHTSGLPRDVPAGGTREDALVAKLGWVRPTAAPGARTAYSNFAMALAGPIVRRASGTAYREWMSARVFEPLGMAGAAWEASQVPADRLATGYLTRAAQGRRRFEASRSEWRMGAAESFGGLYASAEDMARFVAFQLSAGLDVADAGVPLARASLRESQTSAIVVPGETVRYGVCWRIDGPVAVQLAPAHFAPSSASRLVHGGATDEYSAAVVLDATRGAGVVVLSNAAFEPGLEAAGKRVLDAMA